MALLQALLTTCPPSPALTTFGKPRVAGKSSSYTILFRRFLKMLGEGGARACSNSCKLSLCGINDLSKFKVAACIVHTCTLKTCRINCLISWMDCLLVASVIFYRLFNSHVARTRVNYYARLNRFCERAWFFRERMVL